jgi:hypothetical protein
MPLDGYKKQEISSVNTPHGALPPRHLSRLISRLPGLEDVVRLRPGSVKGLNVAHSLGYFENEISQQMPNPDYTRGVQDENRHRPMFF